ncbi:MAG: outer membrane lipoprotein carrier protein LolA [Bryobacteraceae bacterium]
MTRYGVWVCLLTAPVMAAAQDISGLLKAVEVRYNSARTIQVLFEQSYSIPGRSRIVESGQLSLRKPGRMRWQYSVPSGKLFVSDGRKVYLYSPSTNRVETMGLKASDDMRAPLAFLLGKLDFWRDFQKFVTKSEGSDMRLVAEPKSNKLPYSRVEFVVTPKHEIRYLKVTGQDHSITEFRFAGEKLNPALAESLFRFQPPPGAEVVDADAANREGQ